MFTLTRFCVNGNCVHVVCESWRISTFEKQGWSRVNYHYSKTSFFDLIKALFRYSCCEHTTYNNIYALGRNNNIFWRVIPSSACCPSCRNWRKKKQFCSPSTTRTRHLHAVLVRLSYWSTKCVACAQRHKYYNVSIILKENAAVNLIL